MNIPMPNSTPAVLAYCDERIGYLEKRYAGVQGIVSPDIIEARLDELRMVKSLCEGLEKQGNLLSSINL